MTQAMVQGRVQINNCRSNIISYTDIISGRHSVFCPMCGKNALQNPAKFQVFYEPTDVEISTKPFLTSHGSAVKFITPNLAELKYIASHFNIIVDEKLTKLEQVATIAKQLGNHVENLIVTLGEDGLVIARKGLANEPFGKQSSQEVLVRHYPVTKVENIVNVSGAGDSLASGMICGILTGLSEEVCVTVGVEAAKTALKSQSTVAKELFDRTHASWNKKSQYINL